MRLLGFGKGIALRVFIAVQQVLRWRVLVLLINDNRSSQQRGVSIVAHQSPELQHHFVTTKALEDAVLPREIVALTILPQSGFVQQPISLPNLATPVHTMLVAGLLLDSLHLTHKGALINPRAPALRRFRHGGPQHARRFCAP